MNKSYTSCCGTSFDGLIGFMGNEVRVTAKSTLCSGSSATASHRQHNRAPCGNKVTKSEGKTENVWSNFYCFSIHISDTSVCAVTQCQKRTTTKINKT